MTDTNNVALEDEPLIAGVACPNCGELGEDVESQWCSRCGYYAKLGTAIDLDPDWESPQDTSQEPAGVPAWAWQMGIAWFVVAAASLVARLTLSSFPKLHLLFGVTQFVVGTVAFLSLHVTLFISRSLADDGLKLMDLLNPYALWGPLFRDLPQGKRRMLVAWTGLWAAVFAVAITGGVPRKWLEFKETFIEKKKEEEKGGGGPAAAAGNGSLTDAIEDFAEQGTRMVDMPTEDAAADDEQEEEIQWLEMECVIVGFLPVRAAPAAPDAATQDESPETQPDANKDAAATTPAAASTAAKPAPGFVPSEDVKIGALVVASTLGNRIVVVGYVTDGVGAVSNDLLKSFEGHYRSAPFARCQSQGYWVAPKFLCRILYRQWDRHVGLIEPKFGELLDEL